MNHGEVVQYAVDHLGLLKGADTNFGVPDELPCVSCGGMVDLSALITMRVIDIDGADSEETMTEANARQLMAEMGVVPPVVFCEGCGA